MTGPNERTLLIAAVVAVVPFRIFALVRSLWNMPLRNGPNYFLGVAVPPGFYDRPGGWLRRYHAVLVSEHLVEAAGLAAILALAEWSLLPAWMGGGAVLFTATLFGFAMVARRALGGNPPVLPGVAVSLERRRVADYVAWPAEAIAVALVALSWWLLLRHSGSIHSWKPPILLSWVVLGLLPGKIAVVRAGWPLPPESTEEHHRAQDSARRFNIRLLDWFGWLSLIVLVGAALGRTWPAERAAIAWGAAVVFFAAFFGMALTIIRGQQQIDAQVRGLRPCGSWATPFRRTPVFATGGLVWFGFWFGGIVAILLVLP